MTGRMTGVAASGLVVAAVLVHAPLAAIDIPSDHAAAAIEEAFTVPRASIFFTGDIMLARGVEERMREEGAAYPFMYVKDTIAGADVSVGNFEGVVTETHHIAPPMTFSFSVRNEYLTVLKDIGFDVLSLANNHSFDYGIMALDYTRALCREIRIACPGSPTAVGRYSLYTKEVGGVRVGFILIHAALVAPDEKDLLRKLKELEKESDVQIAYVHWGEEYKLMHTRAQERLAHLMIDNGIDAVIGHHPHVVEDVELYHNTPIFYSLGNFVFDQYFSEDVQEGLGIDLKISDTAYVYELTGFTSKDSRNQPQLMREEEERALFERILKPVEKEEGVESAEGRLTLPRT